jgi:hypothetical protein
MTRQLWLLLLVAGSVFASGGDVGGNGGDLVVCDLPGGQGSYELLDYFEAAQQKPAALFELGSADWDAVRKVEHAISRLRPLDPVRAARYEATAKHFLSLVDWITSGPGLEHIPDLGKVAIPSHCKVKQVAIRRTKTFHPSIKPYLIDERLWLKLDEDHRAGLILHELVWGEMFDLGQTNSLNARKFNALLSSAAFDSMPISEYEALTKSLFQEFHRPAFRADKFDINAIHNQYFALDLRSLLQHPVKGALRWSFMGPVPAWLTLSSATDRIFGTPKASDVGTEVLTLVVQAEESGAIAQIRIHIK